MENKEGKETLDNLKEVIQKQGSIITILAVRVSVLEKLLIDKGVITEKEKEESTIALSNDLVGQIKSAFEEILKKKKE